MKKNATPPSALALLKADHDKVLALLREFASLQGRDGKDERKAELVGDICHEATLHALLEQEIFYPLLRAAIDDEDLLDEADVEHMGTRDLIAQLEVMVPGDEHYDATVTVLGEQLSHHIEKEEEELFLAARHAHMDLDLIGAQLQARRDELDDDAHPRAPDRPPMHAGSRRMPRPPN